jgi:glycosyltransferase involved in cell wall biosynthesis
MADEQARRGDRVEIFSAREPEPGVRQSGARIVAVPLRSSRPLSDLEYLARVSWMTRRRRFDVIHAHGMPMAAAALRRRTAGSVISVDYFEFRGSSSRAGRMAYRWLLERFSVVTAVSRYTAGELASHYRLTRTVPVLHNGVDLTHFSSRPQDVDRVRRKFNLPDSFVLYVGRINAQKGSDMLEPLAQELHRHGALPVVAAGPLQQFHSESDIYADQGLPGPSVRYLGRVEDEDLPGLMSAASLLVLPTRHHEMFGMVLIEAGACGTPAVASRLGGIPEALGNAGVLFPPGEQGSLNSAVLDACSQPEELELLAVRARENAATFSWPRIVDEAEVLYRRAAGVDP